MCISTNHLLQAGKGAAGTLLAVEGTVGGTLRATTATASRLLDLL